MPRLTKRLCESAPVGTTWQGNSHDPGHGTKKDRHRLIARTAPAPTT